MPHRPLTATPGDVGLYDDVYTVNRPNPVSGTNSGPDPVSWGFTSNATAENPVALGYHHNRVDYRLTGDMTFSGAGALTIQPGVVVCVGDLWSTRYLKADDGGKIVCDGDPQGDGYCIITTCPTSSMYVKAKTFDNTIQGILRIYDDASPNCRVSDTIFLWNSSLYVYRRLLTPIESNRFACSYYGMCNYAENSARNNLFYVCNYGLYESGVFVGTATSSSNTFDHCPSGFRCSTTGSGRGTVVRDSLFTKCGYGVYAMQYTGATFTEDHNAFWYNSINFYKDGAPRTPDGSDIVLDPGQCPYDRPAGDGDDRPKQNTATWYLDQTSSWTIVDDGSCTSIEAGLDIFTTSADGRPDTGPPWQDPEDIWRPNKLDIGYHFPIAPSQCILHPGLRQTDIALRWNNMTYGCLRAFSFDGHLGDEMGHGAVNDEGTGLGYYRYRYFTSYYYNYDYSRCALLGGGKRINVGSASDTDSHISGQPNLTQFTISCWVYITDIDSSEPQRFGTIYRKYWEQGGGEVIFALKDKTPAGCRLYGKVACQTQAAETETTGRVSLNRWHNVQMTWGPEKTIGIYLNGVQMASTQTDGQGGQCDDSGGDGYIGATSDGACWISGYLADWFIYGKVLSEERGEIRWLAQVGAYQPLSGTFNATPNMGAMGDEKTFPVGQMEDPAYAVEDTASALPGIWVSEFGADRVSKISRSGHVVATIGGTTFIVGYDPGEGNGLFYGPWGLALDSTNNELYVVDESNERIQVFDHAGNFRRKWGTVGAVKGELDAPLCIAVHGGYVYVTDWGNYRICKFDTMTNFIGWWGKESVVSDPLSYPPGMEEEMESGGNYVHGKRRDYKVVITQTGNPDKFSWWWKKEGDADWTLGGQPVEIALEKQSLNYGVWVLFKATTGHALNDRWEFHAGGEGSVPGWGWHDNQSDKKGARSAGGAGLLGYTVFTPGGLGSVKNDMYLGGTYTDNLGRAFVVKIVETGSPDKFRWSQDAGDNWTPPEGETALNVSTQWTNLSYGVQVRWGETAGHIVGDQWQFATRTKKEFYALRGIDADDSGNIWVLDCGEGGDINYIKKFLLKPDGSLELVEGATISGDAPDNGVMGHGLSWNGGYLYTGSGDMELDGLIFNKYSEAGAWAAHWGVQGPLPPESFSCWGVHVTPRQPPTLLTTDWFGSKVQEWALDGVWKGTFWWPLRADGYSMKCRNDTQQSRKLCQRVNLAERSYKLQFLAFANGEEITYQTGHVFPFAAKATGEVPGNNEIQQPSMHYDNPVLTYVDVGSGNRSYCLVSGDFTVASGRSGLWDLGLEAGAKGSGANDPPRVVFVASFTCLKQ